MTRLLDKSIFDYELARADLAVEAELFSPKAFTAVMRASSHIESCVVVLARALRFYAFIKGNKNSTPLDREIKRRLDRFCGPIKKIRDLAEHLYEKEFEGEDVPPRAPIAPAILDDGATIKLGTLTLATQELAEVILLLSEVAIVIGESENEPSP